jgi:hypothetical protein
MTAQLRRLRQLFGKRISGTERPARLGREPVHYLLTEHTAPSDGGGKGFSATAPSISPPKGGGAIKGIGAKFLANSVTGTGSMSVPIATYRRLISCNNLAVVLETRSNRRALTRYRWRETRP